MGNELFEDVFRGDVFYSDFYEFSRDLSGFPFFFLFLGSYKISKIGLPKGFSSPQAAQTYRYKLPLPRVVFFHHMSISGMLA